MRVTIKGLTDSTITFNTIGIILRGNSLKSDLYPNSIARHIEINNDAQKRELITLKNAKLISVIDEDECVNQVPVIKSVQIPPPEPKKEEIEDMPSAPIAPTAPTETTETITKRIPKSKKAKTQKLVKAAKIKKLGNVLSKPQNNEEDSKIVVMTSSGPVTGNAISNMAGEIPESEATRASIEALKQMEDEEVVPESLIDESKLDVSERMGTQAVVATGERNVTKISMRNSILPEASSIKNREIKFIDPNGEGKTEVVDESVKDIFIDSDGKNDTDDDSFIEM